MDLDGPDQPIEKPRFSLRFLASIFEVCEERGVDPRVLLVDVPYPREFLCDPSRTIDWDSYCQLMRNLEDNFSDEEIIKMSRMLMRQPSLRLVSIVARQLFSAGAIYRWVFKAKSGLVPKMHPWLETSVVEAGPQRIQIELIATGGVEAPRAGWLIYGGVMMEFPVVIGLPPAEVETHFTPGGARYDVSFVARAGALAWLRWAVRRPFRARSEAETFYGALDEEYRRLERAVEEQRASEGHRRHADHELRDALAQIALLTDRLERESYDVPGDIDASRDHEEIVGCSPALRRVLRLVEQVASTDVSVLLLGETGTGKELLARAIHRSSARSERPMVTLDCAALPPDLVETELFGRVKGAYTGAESSQPGRFEIADGSTLFLDEVAELTPQLQIKLLRVLQEGDFERVGSTRTIHVDVRIIAATNRNLPAMIQAGEFRDDLYYRLNVFPILVPALRERPEDIPLLIWSFARQIGQKSGRPIEHITRSSMEAAERYPWPGNIRELGNVVERAAVMSQGSTLDLQLPDAGDAAPKRFPTLAAAERALFTDVLGHTGWRVRGEGGAAEILDMKPTTLESRMAKLGIERPSGRSGRPRENRDPGWKRGPNL